MTLQQLKYIIEIVNSGSMSEAAKRLYISQPSLSNVVKELERESGITLFMRTNKGVVLSVEGTEFLGYARQIVEQAELLESRYFNSKPIHTSFSISTQHYSFAVNAFVALIKKYGNEEYDFNLRETRTYEIIEDVKSHRSEIGILYLSSFNNKVMVKLFKENNLTFNPLFTANPHIFVSKHNPLSKKEFIALDDLKEYPYLSFEQGTYNSFYFSEEILSTVYRKKNIVVSDRATLFNLLIGLNGYTISTGIISAELNGTDIVSVPLKADELITVGWIVHKDMSLSKLGMAYIEELKSIITENGFEIE
ncbi:MAG: LysR family transcriptional regulator [Clostridiales bacterium GWF2_36_10]|nr:MAG: LysR family transcriptional regulator [Clostridiales bacterium GWF2_36_10]HAN21204.1 LysR family transcriptional regulator [Clostridiales bacterium]